MNDWDRMIKEVSLLYDDPEGAVEEEFELPEGYTEAPGDGYGFYGYDEYNRLTLICVSKYDDKRSYCIKEGCEVILEDAFKDQPYLKELSIPASVTVIPEGTLSNSGDWTEDEKGISSVKVSEKNTRFYADENGFYEKCRDKAVKLLLYLGGKEAVLGDGLSEVGQKAFFGKDIDKICFEAEGYVYDLPKHKFFREELLDQFGRNSKLYDFSEYDAFVRRNHFSAERIRMLCQRLEQPKDLNAEMREKLIGHIRGSMKHALESLAEENAIEELRRLASNGIFDRENISEAIELLNNTDKREMLTYLMDYRNEHFGFEDFDFSI